MDQRHEVRRKERLPTEANESKVARNGQTANNRPTSSSSEVKRHGGNSRRGKCEDEKRRVRELHIQETKHNTNCSQGMHKTSRTRAGTRSTSRQGQGKNRNKWQTNRNMARRPSLKTNSAENTGKQKSDVAEPSKCQMMNAHNQKGRLGITRKTTTPAHVATQTWETIQTQQQKAETTAHRHTHTHSVKMELATIAYTMKSYFK